MRILKIEIEEFGKLTDFVLEPGVGLNLIEGENESGKSTLLAFLRYMLYGFPRRGSGADGEEWDKRLSWRSRRAAGRLELEFDGARYRIARQCVLRGSGTRESLAETLSVVRLPEASELSLGGKTPGEYFLGLPAELYDGSLCLSQSGADRVCAPGMGEAVGELLFEGGSAFSAEQAETKLQQARRDLQHLKGRGGRIADLEDELAALDGTLSRAREEGVRLTELRADAACYRRQIEEKKGQLGLISAALESAELDRILSLFDDRARARAEEMQCREALAQVQARLKSELPDGDFAARVGLTLREVAAASAQAEQLAPEAERLASVKHDEKLLRGAERIKEQGGAKALLIDVAAKERRIKISRITGVIFGVLAVVAALAAGLLPTWRVPAAILAAAVLAVAIGACVGGLRCRRGVKKLLDRIGAVGTPMLRTYLEQCRREEEAFLSHKERLAAVEYALADVRRRQGEAQTRLNAEFAAMGGAVSVDSPEAVERYLEALAHRKSELQTALSEATIAYERAKTLAAALSDRLAGENEARLRARRAELPDGGEHTEELREKRALLEQSIAALEQKRADAERAESVLAATAQDPAVLEREHRAVANALETARRRLAAIRLALDALARAGDALRREVIPQLATAAGRYFAELTDGIHGELHLSSELSITVDGGGIPRAVSRFSAGCRDAAYLSLRLALLSTLSKERLPLFFDEAFARLDDTRTKALLDILRRYCREGGQCLLFTCHRREGELLAGDTSVRRFVMPSDPI